MFGSRKKKQEEPKAEQPKAERSPWVFERTHWCVIGPDHDLRVRPVMVQTEVRRGDYYAGMFGGVHKHEFVKCTRNPDGSIVKNGRLTTQDPIEAYLFVRRILNQNMPLLQRCLDRCRGKEAHNRTAERLEKYQVTAEKLDDWYNSID